MGQTRTLEVSNSEMKDYFNYDVVSEMRRYAGSMMNGNVVYRAASTDELHDIMERRPGYFNHLFAQATTKELGIVVTARAAELSDTIEAVPPAYEQLAA